jgi:hypothetical protein
VFVSRRCGRCHEDLPSTAFARAGAGYQHWCRGCFRAYFRERGALHVKQVNAAKALRQEPLRRRVISHLKEHPCVDCGEDDLRVLEFDHREHKDDEVGQLVLRAVPVERLDAEIARCDVVCVNCHRHRTAERGHWWRLTSVPPEREARRPRQVRNIAWLYAHLRASRCCDCGIADLVVLDFDHVGEKRAGVVNLAWSEYSIAALEREIAQCEIRCGNCHRRRTTESRGWYRGRAR